MDDMADRILAGRWAPAKSVTKRQLRDACAATEITPRPNWLHASHEELMEALAEPLLRAGVLVSGRMEVEALTGGRGVYQSEARWGVRRIKLDSPPGFISWNVQTGKMRASLPGPRYAAARAAVEEAVRLAESQANIRREDIRNQLALAIMDDRAVAPFCPLTHIEPVGHVWVVAVDSMEFNRTRRFLQMADAQLLNLSEIEGPADALSRAIRLSLGSAERRYGTRSGWQAIAKASHDRLLERLPA